KRARLPHLERVGNLRGRADVCRPVHDRAHRVRAHPHPQRARARHHPVEGGLRPAYTATGCSTRPSWPNTRSARAIAAGLPSALLGLSESFTAGRPLAVLTLHTSEIAASPGCGLGAQPAKSLVRFVPQPKLMRTLPLKCR